jgi:glycerophosphoryl diester phosphodiesterase
MKKLPKVIAHRGASAYAPENTIASLDKARQLSVEWVEIDAMLAKCGEAILIHDTHLDRTTTGKGAVNDFTYAQIADLDAGAWFSDQYLGEKIPTLTNALTYLHQHSMSAIVEIKPYHGQEKRTADEVARIMKQVLGDKTEFILSSFSIASLYAARLSLPGQHLGLALAIWDDSWQYHVETLSCQSLHVDHRLLNQERVFSVKERGLNLFAYTVNDLLSANKLLQWGVDGIFSDYPDQIQVAALDFNSSEVRQKQMME